MNGLLAKVVKLYCLLNYAIEMSMKNELLMSPEEAFVMSFELLSY